MTKSVDVADYNSGLLTAHAGETKSGHARSVPCTARVRALIDPLPDGPLFPGLTNSALTKQWGDLRSILGKDDDPGFIVHVMRHTCATRLVFKKVPLNEVQAWMGHKVIQTTMRYAHLMPGALMRAMGMLEAREPEPEPA